MIEPSVIAISGWAHAGEAMMGVVKCVPALKSLCFSIHDLDTGNERPSDFSLDAPSEYAKSLLAVLDEQESPAVLIGWSMGGMVALEAAAFWPERVKRLILLSTTARFCSSPDYPFGVPEKELRALLQLLKRDPESALRAFARNCLLPLQEEPAATEAFVAQARTYTQTSLESALLYLQRCDLRGRLNQIQFPVTIIHGEHDAVIPVSAAVYLANHLPNASVKILSGVGHDGVRAEFARDHDVDEHAWKLSEVNNVV